jgi:hypothetical protein
MVGFENTPASDHQGAKLLQNPGAVRGTKFKAVPIFDNVSRAPSGIKILFRSQILQMLTSPAWHCEQGTMKFTTKFKRRAAVSATISVQLNGELEEAATERRTGATQSEPHYMQMICLRTIAFVDVDLLAFREGREALFRDDDTRFFLYLSKHISSSQTEERIVALEAREALIWLNEDSQEQGSFWA